MDNIMGQTLKKNVRLMKTSVTRYAVYGVIIAFLAILVATLTTCYLGLRQNNS